MAQLTQLSGGLAASRPAGWQAFEYEFWAEIMAHTHNFLEYFEAKWDVEGAEDSIQKIRDNVIRDDHIDINVLIDNSDKNRVWLCGLSTSVCN